MPTLAGLTVLLVAQVANSTPTTPAAGTVPVARPVQELAALGVSHIARTAPRQSAPKVQTIAARRPLANQQTVLPVVGHARDAVGRAWLQVRLPGRPNGHTGWIVRSATKRMTTDWHIVIVLSRRSVVAYRKGRAVATFPAVVGKSSTPTPTGEFFVEETLALPSWMAGEPYALALSARSNVYQEFEGGPGQVALHGIAHIGGTPGTAVSHGCVRLESASVTWLVDRMGPGVPVSIQP